MRGRELNLKSLAEKEKGYLFGLFEGNGYKIHDKKNRHYIVEWYLNSIKDKQIINFLEILLKRAGLMPNFYKDKRFNCKRVRVYSKNLFGKINKNINLSNKSKDFKLGFVSGMIDSEGHVSKEKNYIMIININKDILEKCREFLKETGIKSRINKRLQSRKDKLNSYKMYISVNFKRLNHLSIKAGKFQSGVEAS